MWVYVYVSQDTVGNIVSKGSSSEQSGGGNQMEASKDNSRFFLTRKLSYHSKMYQKLGIPMDAVYLLNYDLTYD